MRGPLPLVLFYIPLMLNVCAMLVMHNESTDNTEDIMLFYKIQNFPKNNYIGGARFNSSGTL